MTRLRNLFIDVTQIVFVVATLVILTVAFSYLYNGGNHLMGIAWIAIAMGCLGNVTNWRKQ